jgi:hypothetical protein
MNKKLFLPFLLLLTTLYVNAQNNEFVFYAGIGLDGKEYWTEILQSRYSYKYSDFISFQGGIRQQNQLTPIIDEYYTIIDNAYLSRKIDLTFLIIPINIDKFKIGIGAGVDLGFSRYYITSKTVSLRESARGKYNTYVYGQHKYIHGFEPGLHALMQVNYYVGNSMFFSGQLLFNNMIGGSMVDKGLPEQKGLMSISIGLGSRF